MDDADIKKLAKAIAEEVAKILYKHHRDEISLRDICTEYNISKQTIYRRIKCGVLPEPRKKGNKNFFNRTDIERADIKGLL